MEDGDDMFLLSVEDEEKLFSLRKYTAEEMKVYVKELEEWYKTQKHFPQSFKFDSAVFLERSFKHCFYKMELTKKRMDLHFTYIAKNKQFYDLLAGDKFLLPSRNPLQVAVHPNLHKNGERVVALYLTSTDVEPYEFDHVIQIGVALLELGFKLDRAHSLIAVVNCENFNIDWAKKTDIAKFIRFVVHLHETYTCRITGIHLLHAGSAVQFFSNLCKLFVTGRILSAMNVHDSVESLHKMIEPSYLPAEFGGTCGPIKHLTAKLDKLFLKNRDYLGEVGKFAADESKRETNDHNGSTFDAGIFF